jgi:diphthamide synthase (EF-2-diphthine--ammonia ligase)
MTGRNCMLWSGGKDSFVAYSTVAAAERTDPSDWVFVTFVPAEGEFRCHPLGLLQRHGEALEVEHLFVVVDGDDWQAAYRSCFERLRDHWQVERVVTGDILVIDQTVEDYWLVQLLRSLGIEPMLPLAGLSPEELFTRIDQLAIEPVFTGVAAWVDTPGLVGAVASLPRLLAAGLDRHPHLDLTGENGEYHTTVVAAAGRRFAPTDAIRHPTARVPGLDVATVDPDLHQLTAPRIHLPTW